MRQIVSGDTLAMCVSQKKRKKLRNHTSAKGHNFPWRLAVTEMLADVISRFNQINALYVYISADDVQNVKSLWLAISSVLLLYVSLFLQF